MATVQIDKGIKIPQRSGGPGRKYPWADMEVGDSFFSTAKSIREQSAHAGKVYGRKFATRKEGNGIRVWRVE